MNSQKLWLITQRSWLITQRSWLITQRSWLITQRSWLITQRSWLFTQRSWVKSQRFRMNSLVPDEHPKVPNEGGKKKGRVIRAIAAEMTTGGQTNRDRAAIAMGAENSGSAACFCARCLSGSGKHGDWGRIYRVAIAERRGAGGKPSAPSR
jgi:hypothetical protein